MTKHLTDLVQKSFSKLNTKAKHIALAATLIASMGVGHIKGVAETLISTVDPNFIYSAELKYVQDIGNGKKRFTYEIDNLSDPLGGDGYDLTRIHFPAEGVDFNSIGTSSLPGFIFELYENEDANGDEFVEPKGIYGHAILEAFNVPAAREPATFSFISTASGLVDQQMVMHSYSGASLAPTVLTPVNYPTLSIDQTETSLNENESPTLTFNLNKAVGYDSSINFTIDGTANNEDYSLTNGTITFPKGTTTQQIEIPIADDGLYEPNETVVLHFDEAQHLIIGNETYTHTIVNDDEERILSFSRSIDVGEEGLTPTLEARLSVALPDKAVTATLERAPGRAIEGEDYTLNLPMQIVIAPGELSQTIPLVGIDNAVDQPATELRLMISNVENATLGQSVYRIVWNDNDPAPYVKFSEHAHSGKEGENFPLSLKLLDEEGMPTYSRNRINLTVHGVDGNPLDYLLGPIMLFEPGEREKLVSLVVHDNDVVDGDRTFSLQLNSDSYAQTSGELYVRTILDDDGSIPPPIESIRIQPNAPGTNDDLRLEISLGQPWDNPEDESYSIVWKIGGQSFEQTGRPPFILPNHYTRKGDEIYAEADTVGAEKSGTMVQAPQVRIVNTPPKVTYARVDYTFEKGASIEDLTITDPDIEDKEKIDANPAQYLTVDWYVNGKMVPNQHGLQLPTTYIDNDVDAEISVTDGEDASLDSYLALPNESIPNVPVTGGIGLGALSTIMGLLGYHQSRRKDKN